MLGARRRAQPGLGPAALKDQTGEYSTGGNGEYSSGGDSHEQLLGLSAFERFHRESLAAYPGLNGRRLLYETLRRMRSAQVCDVIDTSSRLIEDAAPGDASAARLAGPLITFSAEAAAGMSELKVFLRRELYRHPRVVRTTEGAKSVVRTLFEVYSADPHLLPKGRRGPRPGRDATADYIAGMTDRFALREHRRLTGVDADFGPDI